MRRRPTPQPPSPLIVAEARARRREETGSAAVELTLLTPLLILLLLFVVAAGRITSARITVQDAAQAAARTLTLSPITAGTGSADIEKANAAAATATGGLPCEHLVVSVTDPSSGAVAPAAVPAAVQVVTVQVACTVNLGDLTGLGLPATTVITVTATSPRDRYRSDP